MKAILTYIKNALIGCGCLIFILIIVSTILAMILPASSESNEKTRVEKEKAALEEQRKNAEEQKKKDFEEWLTPSQSINK